MPNSSLRTSVDLEQLVEAIGDAIVVSDASGTINLWNPAAERLFGFTQAEALGNSLDLIVPERLRERHWAGYRKTMASGETRYVHDLLRVPAVHREGQALSIAFTVGLLFGSGSGRCGYADRRPIELAAWTWQGPAVVSDGQLHPGGYLAHRNRQQSPHRCAHCRRHRLRRFCLADNPQARKHPPKRRVAQSNCRSQAT